MRARSIGAMIGAITIGATAFSAAGPVSAAEKPLQNSGEVTVLGDMPTSTTTKAKVRSAGQKARSANIGVNKNGYSECKAHAVSMEKVTWNLGKVTRSSARVKSIKVSYYNERKLHVGSAYLNDGNHRERWRKSNGWIIPKGSTSRTYKINKTVKFSKRKPLNFMLHVELGRANEPVWCHPKVKLYFYLKPNR